MSQVSRTGRPSGRDAETAKAIAHHLLNTADDKMQETTYIPLRLVHPLSMLQALEGQYEKLQEQIADIDLWTKVKLNPQYTPPPVPIDGDGRDPKSASKNLFIHKFRSALHGYLRGKDGLFLEKMVILADTDLQTRGTNPDEIFRRQVREQ